MIDDQALNRLMRRRKETPNVPAFDRRPYADGKKTLAPAAAHLRSLAQNLIDETHEHRHLRAARVLLLVESSEAMARKLARGERVSIGRAYRSTPIERVLAASLTAKGKGGKPGPLADRQPPLPGFDFIVKLNGDWLHAVGYFDGEEEGIRKALALVDHELLHCGVKIAGQFVERGELDRIVEGMGELHVETCRDVRDDKGRVLVRYQVLDEAGRFAWKLRKHDVEEFHGVAQRWGAWSRDVGRLVDVVVERDGAKDAPPAAAVEGRKAAKRAAVPKREVPA